MLLSYVFSNDQPSPLASLPSRMSWPTHALTLMPFRDVKGADPEGAPTELDEDIVLEALFKEPVEPQTEP